MEQASATTINSLFHVDPINLIVVIGGFIAAWVTMRAESKRHGTWIDKHDRECDEQRKANTAILTALQVTNSHLVTLVESQEKRLDSVNDESIRIRERVHDVEDIVHRLVPRK